MRLRSSWVYFGALHLFACAGAGDDPSSGGGGAGGAGSSSTGGEGGSGAEGGAQASVSSSASSSTTTATSSSTTGAGGGPVCGDGVIEPGETCEGDDFGGKTCASFGLSSGTLVCNAFCNVVLSGCVPKETCNDGLDNDEDGLFDCDDPDCASATICTDSCAGLSPTLLPTFDFGVLAGRPDNLSVSCTASTGREQIFAVMTSGMEDLSVRLIPSGFDGSISVRTACQDPSSEIACVDAGGTNATESLSVSVAPGQTYFVIVEATSPAGEGFYDVYIDQPQPETQCGNWFDDDFDGYFDCDDPSECKGQSFDCTPGGQAYGTGCFSHTQCQATGGDPFCMSFGQGFP